MKYITDFNVDHISKDNIDEYVAEYKASDKAMILRYMRKFEPSLFTSAPAVDAVTGKIVAEADNGYSDGEYTWYEADIYYFDQYNVRLTSDFIEYVKKAS